MFKYAEQEQQDTRNTRHLVAGATGVGLAGVPFLGLIGRRPVVNDPYYNRNIRRVSMGRLSQLAQPGDVLLTAKRKGTGWQYIQTPMDSLWYHAQPVVGRFHGQRPIGEGTTLSVNSLAGYPDETSTRRAIKDLSNTVAGEAKASRYSDMLLLRPKKRLTQAELDAFIESSVKGAKNSYNIPQAVRAWLKDVVLPKMGKRTKTELPVNYKPCADDMCSTMSAHAYSAGTGKSPVQGKLPKDVLPVDYIRRGSEYEPVAAHLSFKPPTQQTLRMRGLASRAGMGLGLGALAAGGIEDPATLPIVPAFVGAPMLAQKLLREYRYHQAERANKPTHNIWEKTEKSMPGYGGLLDNLTETHAKGQAIRRNILRRTLPLSLAAAAGSYGLARLLKNKISPDEEPKK